MKKETQMEGQDPAARRKRRLKDAKEDLEEGLVTVEAYEQRFAHIYAVENLGNVV